MYTRVGIVVSESFLWPILIMEGPSVTNLGRSPSLLTNSLLPARKFMIVLFPTPVSPTTMMASWAYSSLGMALIPYLMRFFNFLRSNLLSISIIFITLYCIMRLQTKIICLMFIFVFITDFLCLCFRIAQIDIAYMAKNTKLFWVSLKIINL